MHSRRYRGWHSVEKTYSKVSHFVIKIPTSNFTAFKEDVSENFKFQSWKLKDIKCQREKKKKLKVGT